MVGPSPVVALNKHFAALADPRGELTKLHPLLSIVVIALCAVICGAESWDDIAECGDTKQNWLASFLDLPNGSPAHDTFNRIFAALDPRSFRACFLRRMQAAATGVPTEGARWVSRRCRARTVRPTGKRRSTWCRRGPAPIASFWARSRSTTSPT